MSLGEFRSYLMKSRWCLSSKGDQWICQNCLTLAKWDSRTLNDVHSVFLLLLLFFSVSNLVFTWMLALVATLAWICFHPWCHIKQSLQKKEFFTFFQTLRHAWKWKRILLTIKLIFQSRSLSTSMMGEYHSNRNLVLVVANDFEKCNGWLMG